MQLRMHVQGVGAVGGRGGSTCSREDRRGCVALASSSKDMGGEHAYLPSSLQQGESGKQLASTWHSWSCGGGGGALPAGKQLAL